MSRITQRRNSSSDEEGGGANWMDTYGDLVTLLLTFFVFLFAFSSVDAEKWRSIVGAFSGTSVFASPGMGVEAIMSPAIPSFNTVGDEEPLDTAGLDEFLELYENISNYVGENQLDAELLANQDTRTLIMRFSANVLFQSGSAEIAGQFYDTMDHIIAMFAENTHLIHMIRIEGHTDDVPIHTAEFSDNWDLSIKRATNVLRYFIASNDIDDAKISAVGYGEYHPVVENDTPENRAKNRRVDFVIESAQLKK